MSKIQIHVAVATVLNQAGQVLIAKRKSAVHQGDKWEFPGGKREIGESIEETLIRELAEEISITPIHYKPLIKIAYQYPEKNVLLDTWQVTAYSGEVKGREGQPVMWKMPDELKPEDFPPANIPIIHALRLPDRCFITPDFNGNEAAYLYQVVSVLKKGVKLIQFRSCALQKNDYLNLAFKLEKACRCYNAQLILNTDTAVLNSIDAQGIHLNSARLLQCRKRPLPYDKWFSASCHSETEIRRALELDVDFIFVSPVKYTDSHPFAEPIGWERLANLCDLSTVPVYALGGMDLGDIPIAQAQGAQGVAAIRAFLNPTNG